MIIPVNIRGQTLNFCVSPALVNQETRVKAHIVHLVAALNMIPVIHLQLLAQVPIVIWKRPNGERGKGGWVAPTVGRGDGNGDQNALYSAWLNGRRGRRFDVQEDLNSLPNSNGIIHMTDVALFRPAFACQLTILHETGHCVDYHLDLNSTPIHDDSYRSGNRPYQGQLYSETGYNYHEFKAETYSRLFIRPNALCRRQRADPVCQGRGHSNCNQRIKQDLANSPAFRVAGTDAITLLGLAPATSYSEDQPEITRGPVGVVNDAKPIGDHSLPRSTFRMPGPLGCLLRRE